MKEKFVVAENLGFLSFSDCNDQELLSTAFNKSRMGPSTFKVENAIDWIFNQRSVETEKPRMTQVGTEIVGFTSEATIS